MGNYDDYGYYDNYDNNNKKDKKDGFYFKCYRKYDYDYREYYYKCYKKYDHKCCCDKKWYDEY
ncbi:hypothetical protein [Peribacillus frigoritolerans]|uniref:Spore coat protein C n=1 Tax=Peribacillus castrilensis TaxID=2897690 RepID=A0AAW9NFI7_9BACI|nr:hypothetical protein [Peribacillus castrilensis]